jgi:Big-like domain-containing protein
VFVLPNPTAVATTTTLASSLNPSTFGQPVTFTATVKATSGTPTGTVTFKDGTTTIGTGALSAGKATFKTSKLAKGIHSITAMYGGSISDLGSTSPVLKQTVN